MDETVRLFQELMDRLNEETKKYPSQNSNLHGFDNLIDANQKVVEAFHQYNYSSLFKDKEI